MLAVLFCGWLWMRKSSLLFLSLSLCFILRGFLIASSAGGFVVAVVFRLFCIKPQWVCARFWEIFACINVTVAVAECCWTSCSHLTCLNMLLDVFVAVLLQWIPYSQEILWPLDFTGPLTVCSCPLISAGLLKRLKWSTLLTNRLSPMNVFLKKFLF